MWTWSVRPDDVEAGKTVALTNQERIALAKVGLAGESGATIFETAHKAGGTTFETESGLLEACQSVGRFGLVVDKTPREVRDAGAVCVLSETGQERLAGIKARRYACCEHAVAIPCVCSESVYCPQEGPEHRGGCHGTHD